MTIQLERQYGPQQFEQPLRPNRSKGDMARFWAPKEKTTEKTSFFPAFKKAKTPQPQKKMVSFWETQSSHTTSRNLITTSSKSMTSLVDENRGYTPSEVAKDPAKREFLTNLSKKIFSPPNDGKKRQITRSFARESRRQQMFEKTIGDGITLGQVMTPVQDPAYDTSSLKRRNPRQMFTDSAFYSPKFHPSVAEQVEMAHKLSSSLFEDGNKNSKGHDMFLKRAKKSGKWVTTNQPNNGDTMEFEPEIPKHDKTPNLKLVMNPEGKLHDWQDLPEEEVPEMVEVNVGNPEVAHTLGIMVQNLNEEKGRGKVSFTPVGAQQGAPQQFKATPSFAGGFRQVFDTRRGMFEQSVVGTRPHNTTCTTPKLARSKTLPDIPQIIEEPTLKRPHPSPLVPKRSSSKQMVAMMEQDSNRRPLRSFFSNA